MAEAAAAAAAAGGTDTSSTSSTSGGSSSPMDIDPQPSVAPPLPVAFFHRIYSSDLSRARQTAELVVWELIRPPAAKEGSSGLDVDVEKGCVEGLIRFDRDLREILAGTLF